MTVRQSGVSPAVDKTTARLERALREACTAANTTGACVGLIQGNAVSVACVDDVTATEGSSAFDAHTALPVACLAKPLTASILVRALARAAELEAFVQDVFGHAVDECEDIIAATRVHQLLTHTHGLDGSLLRQAPKRADGSIALDQLARHLRETPRIFAPTEPYFSYGDAGAWIAAALAEHRLGRNYGESVRELIPELETSNEDLCAASGGKMSLTMTSVLAFLQLQMRSDTGAALRMYSATFPGWCPPREAACCGWYVHGNGWYGHNGLHRNNALLVRFNPAKDVAFAISAVNDRLAKVIAARLFGNSLPELTRWPQITRLTDTRLAVLAPQECVGRYGNARTTATVTASSDGQLSLTMSRGDASAHPIHAATASTGELIHLLIPNQPPFEGFLQFIKRPATSSPDADQAAFIWDGRTLLPRRGAAESMP